MNRRSIFMTTFVVVLVAALGAAARVAVATPSAATAETLNLRAKLNVLSITPPRCPAETPPDANECRTRTGGGLARGLGRVSENYTWSYRLGPPTCAAGLGKPLATTGRLVVRGKGEIRFALVDGARCIEQAPLRNEPQTFTITGGTGVYEGASGAGTVERAIASGSGTETWIGTLTVPGFEFDTTPPVLSGAASKTVQALKGVTRVRVTYKVSARDRVDGQVAVTCDPRSGSRFRLGRTSVRCSATDSSGNTARKSFVVTVRRAT